jgi:hypothetical protein
MKREKGRECMAPQSTVRVPELTQVVLEVLGDLAFMISDDEPAPAPAGTEWMRGEVGYHGAANGTLQCWCTRRLAIQLAANLLGIEAEEDPAHTAAEDALREFMNVLCGQLVTSWFGRAAVFNLSIPTVHAGEPTPADVAAAAQDSCRLSVDGEPLVCLSRRGS